MYNLLGRVPDGHSLMRDVLSTHLKVKKVWCLTVATQWTHYQQTHIQHTQRSLSLSLCFTLLFYSTLPHTPQAEGTSIVGDVEQQRAQETFVDALLALRDKYEQVSSTTLVQWVVTCFFWLY